MLPSPATLAPQKPEAKNPLRLSFFSILGLVFRLSSYISLGAGLAFVTFLFKEPKIVEDFPLVRNKGYVYWVQDKSPLGKAWVEKRKRLFEENGAKVRLSNLDLNSWAAQTFPPGSVRRSLTTHNPSLRAFQGILQLERPLPPTVCVQQEGIFLSQPLILHIGKHCSLPLFTQAILYPIRDHGTINLDMQGLSLGWLPIDLGKLKAFSGDSFIVRGLYSEHKELSQLKYLLSQLVDIRLAPGELLLTRKTTAPQKIKTS